MKARAWILMTVVALTAASAGVIMSGWLERLVVFPSYLVGPVPAPPAWAVEGRERLWLDTEQGKVEAWLLPGEGASAARPAAAVIFTHGNGELIDQWPAELAPYRAMGVSVLLPEYRGYGRSAGKPSQRAVTADLTRAYDWLAARADIDASRIVLHGRSIGGGLACSLAEQRRPRALILQSTFTSMWQMARRYHLPRFLVREPFDNLGTVRSYGGPLLVMHGRRDELIPFEQGRRLAELGGGRLVPFEGGHNGMPEPEVYWSEIHDFLTRAGVLETPRQAP